MLGHNQSLLFRRPNDLISGKKSPTPPQHNAFQMTNTFRQLLIHHRLRLKLWRRKGPNLTYRGGCGRRRRARGGRRRRAAPRGCSARRAPAPASALPPAAPPPTAGRTSAAPPRSRSRRRRHPPRAPRSTTASYPTRPPGDKRRGPAAP